jgi:ATP-binding cassette subfamily A (ABC1) protein 3
MQPRETDLEPVDEALQGQTKANQTLILDKLRKVYKNGTVAVGCLDLEMYSNQIFALLGQNGAGKSTTISIISGLLTKTQGSVRILGKNRDTELDEIRKMIGVCPQTNPIYLELTVYEHMELYAKIKGRENGPEMKLEIETILQNIDLAHKSKYTAGKLSGGQKRKLCVATALVGGSKILLLDEPSSGMDTYARRHLWEMLKEYRKDKLIILSTHYMDEADF